MQYGVGFFGELLIELGSRDIKRDEHGYCKYQLYIDSDGFKYELNIGHGNRTNMVSIEIYYPTVKTEFRIKGQIVENGAFPVGVTTVKQIIDYALNHIEETEDATKGREIEEDRFGQYPDRDACGQTLETGLAIAMSKAGKSKNKGKKS